MGWNSKRNQEFKLFRKLRTKLLHLDICLWVYANFEMHCNCLRYTKKGRKERKECCILLQAMPSFAFNAKRKEHRQDILHANWYFRSISPSDITWIILPNLPIALLSRICCYATVLNCEALHGFYCIISRSSGGNQNA